MVIGKKSFSPSISPSAPSFSSFRLFQWENSSYFFTYIDLHVCFFHVFIIGWPFLIQINATLNFISTSGFLACIKKSVESFHELLLIFKYFIWLIEIDGFIESGMKITRKKRNVLKNKHAAESRRIDDFSFKSSIK